MQTTYENRPSWLDRPLISLITLNWETFLFAVIIILGILTRFYDLESRVMSHDETSHVYFSWLFSQGRGYSHDPVTHGPLQFHLVALSYFMFGDNDFTARIPAVLFSIATIGFMWNYRRLLGRAGGLVAALLFLISPYMLYYGRYVRNEAFVALFGVVTIWAILRYLESGSPKYLYWLTAATALHFVAKETSFIYTAQALLFLGVYLVYRLSQQTWARPELRSRFLLAVTLGLVLISLGGGLFVIASSGQPTPVSTPATTDQGPVPSPASSHPVAALSLLSAGLLAFLGAVYIAVRGYTWEKLRSERSFDLLVILGTLVLPMLAPFPVKALGINPIDYTNNQSITITATFVIAQAILAIGVGMFWNRRVWLANTALFYAIFTVFYTSVFTNGFGFFTGLVGSLGYWLEQQGVNRGSQPGYYYWLVQVPVYEYLPALGTILAMIFAPRLLKKSSTPSEDEASVSPDLVEDRSLPGTVLALLIFWSVTSLLAYSIAGEKMPWLTVHIALPLILTAAWFLGRLIETTDWSDFLSQRGWLVVTLLPIFFLSVLATFGSLLGNKPPFQGAELEQLRASSTFITALLTALGSGWGLSSLLKSWSSAQMARVISLAAFGMLGLLTARTAMTAAYINYDNANELLVYAHSASGPKIALQQIEELSRRTTNGLAVRIAYDNETTYPFWWYLRNYTNQDYYDKTPTRAQREAPVILVGDANFGKIEPVVGQAYNQFDYFRIWWPNQDYFDLTRERIIDALLDPQMRAAMFQIWLNRDYTLYGQVTNKEISLTNWSPSSSMRLYIRKDVVASMWNYGVGPAPEAVIADPYEGKQAVLAADLVFGAPGAEPGQFNRPRDLAVAPDGTLYVADTDNHRIQHLDVAGNAIAVWGSFADLSVGQAPGGTFYEPWGIAVAPDGSVFVSDTWNHRIQKFTADGEFIKMWGYFGQAEAPEALWGPRDVLVDASGRVFVTDTGNKRIVVFDSEGNPITQFGTPGLAIGQFDEPTGLAMSDQGTLYVADAWNQRIQSFLIASDNSFQPLKSWEIAGWYGQSLDNKPYLAMSKDGQLIASDPEGYRILEFTSEGEIIRYWGDISSGLDGFGLVGGVAADDDGGVWVSDAGNNRIMHFTLPTSP